MKTWMGVLAALALGASCANEFRPPARYRVCAQIEKLGPALWVDVTLEDAPKVAAGWRAAGYGAWLEISTDLGHTWEQATDDGVQTTFTVEETP